MTKTATKVSKITDRAAGKMNEHLEAELEVMAVCARALHTLSPLVQARVLLYLARRLGETQPT